MTKLEQCIYEAEVDAKEIDLACAIMESELCDSVNKDYIDSYFTEGVGNAIKDFFSNIVEKFRKLVDDIKLKLRQMKIKRGLNKINKNQLKAIKKTKKYAYVDEKVVLNDMMKYMKALTGFCKSIVEASDYDSAERVLYDVSMMLEDVAIHTKESTDPTELIEIMNDEKIIKSLEVTQGQGIKLTKDTCGLLEKKLNGKLLKESKSSIKEEAIKDEQLDKKKIGLVKQLATKFNSACTKAVNVVSKNKVGIAVFLGGLVATGVGVASYQAGNKKGYSTGRTSGYQDGYQKGNDYGYNRGLENANKNNINKGVGIGLSIANQKKKNSQSYQKFYK